MNADPSRSLAARSTVLVLACGLVAAGFLHDGVLSSAALMNDNRSTTASTVGTGSVSLSPRRIASRPLSDGVCPPVGTDATHNVMSWVLIEK